MYLEFAIQMVISCLFYLGENDRPLIPEFLEMQYQDIRDEEGFLVPYKGERYHLSEWRGRGNAPTTARDFFNMKHSSTQNVIEKAFGLLKGRWAILRGKSYYPVDVQCRTIMVCCLLHNLINREMTNSEITDNLDEDDSTYTTTGGDEINYIEASNEWSEWRDQLAHTMFSDWELRD
ncbi:uncharacterized protein LOC127150720 [Cucumis melo]|uniref:Uncharacterized protein LOC127150720 n=2 Tax=Cucumis melo TaxID=3656 RepID=A0ABM3L572_CUCME|nr:uncharacterized protein LOC127150720 [Cucumis melo]